ncbi:MAG: putative toxin-antitoxin system toxin component, PIN family [Bacteroidales bacterium]|nr:putative toxin-antitoxin system toxin component, PIN family [Bacteroidales bacterium]
MIINAVVDTNILVAGMLTSNETAPTRQIIENIQKGTIVPMTNVAIIEEYTDVLSRDKFSFDKEAVKNLLEMIGDRSKQYTPTVTHSDFADIDDAIFYDTYLMRDDAYLITGNLKHFPKESRILSPSDMMQIINLQTDQNNILSDIEYPYMSERRAAIMLRAQEALERIRANAILNGTADMSMEEINEEIEAVRRNRKSGNR